MKPHDAVFNHIINLGGCSVQHSFHEQNSFRSELLGGSSDSLVDIKALSPSDNITNIGNMRCAQNPPIHFIPNTM